MLNIQDSVAVITGGGSGIGRALAEHWLRQGGRVVIADVAEEPLRQAEAELRGISSQVTSIRCNVTLEADCERLADHAIATFGAINLVAPFAGITSDGLMLTTDRDTGMVTGKMSLAQFQKVIDINLTGVFLTVRECVERMVNHRCRGLICLVSSTGSLGTAGQINYASSKAAMSVMPKVLTAEFFPAGFCRADPLHGHRPRLCRHGNGQGPGREGPWPDPRAGADGSPDRTGRGGQSGGGAVPQ